MPRFSKGGNISKGILVRIKMLLSGTLKGIGNLQAKGNRRQILKNFKTGKPIIAKSEKALVWTEGAIYKLKTMWKGQEPYMEPVALMGTVYYSETLSDLDVSLLMDAIEKAGIIGNDRQVYEICFKKQFDKLNPRVEFSLDECSPQ